MALKMPPEKIVDKNLVRDSSIYIKCLQKDVFVEFRTFNLPISSSEVIHVHALNFLSLFQTLQ